MFTLITGLPGSSKSANCLELVEKERIRPDGTKRSVYYWGIPELKLDWIPLHRADSSPEEARSQFDLGVKKLCELGGESHAYGWHEVPADSIVVIDECHFVFPPLTQKQRATPPAHYGPLAVHRHSGFDLYCMTQHPSLMAIEARRQVQRHWHLERPFGLDYSNRLAWEKCESPDDRAARNRADVQRLGLGKSMWGKYRSAEVHTVKKRLPWRKLSVAIGSLLLVVALFVFAFFKLGKHKGEDVASDVAPDAAPAARVSRQWTAEDLQPAFAAWPWSAPMYREAAKFVSVPRIVGCMSMKIGSTFVCKCHNGQGDAGVSAQVCRDFMAGKVFDPTRPVEDVKAENIRRLEAATAERSPGEASSGGGARVMVPPSKS